MSVCLSASALDSIFAYVLDNAVAWLMDPGRIVAEAYRRN